MTASKSTIVSLDEIGGRPTVVIDERALNMGRTVPAHSIDGLTRFVTIAGNLDRFSPIHQREVGAAALVMAAAVWRTESEKSLTNFGLIFGRDPRISALHKIGPHIEQDMLSDSNPIGASSNIVGRLVGGLRLDQMLSPAFALRTVKRYYQGDHTLFLEDLARHVTAMKINAADAAMADLVIHASRYLIDLGLPPGKSSAGAFTTIHRSAQSIEDTIGQEVEPSMLDARVKDITDVLIGLAKRGDLAPEQRRILGGLGTRAAGIIAWRKPHFLTPDAYNERESTTPVLYRPTNGEELAARYPGTLDLYTRIHEQGTAQDGGGSKRPPQSAARLYTFPQGGPTAELRTPARRKVIRANTEERRLRIDAENGPIIVELEGIVQDYDACVAQIYGNSSTARKLHVEGDDSVAKKMRDIFPYMSVDQIKGVALLYTGLIDKGSNFDDADTLQQCVNDAVEIKRRYDTLHAKLQHGGSVTVPSLSKRDMDADMAWLRENIADFRLYCIDACEAHKTVVQQGRIDHFLKLMGQAGELEGEASEAGPAGSDLETNNTLAEAPGDEMPAVRLSDIKKGAELVEWEIMPPEEVTVEDLETILQNAAQLQEGAEGSVVDVANKVLIAERLQMIINWREKYGGILYYSSQRQLDSSGNFYFVQVFERDGRGFAIAENPVYGNATYVMCRELMPLSTDETLLTVVEELGKKSIRWLGGRQIIHRSGESALPHPEKVEKALQELLNTPVDSV